MKKSFKRRVLNEFEILRTIITEPFPYQMIKIRLKNSLSPALLIIILMLV